MTTTNERHVAERFSVESDRSYSMLIDGAWVQSSSGETFACVDPYDNASWGRVPAATVEDVDRAVRAARRAFDEGGWPQTLPSQRAALLRRFADLLTENADELARGQIHENGKLIGEMTWGALQMGQHAHYVAGLAETIQGRTIESNWPNTAAFTFREPIGVVAMITPWNSPLMLLSWKLFAALAAGNTVVIKPSEATPTSTLRMAELAMEAGFPPGVINVVTGFGQPTGSALVDHRGVDKIAFTGSTSAGRAINKQAAERFARVTLELGGKSPNIIFSDADIDNAVHGAMAGIFGATGQTCMGGSRVLVQDSIYDDFVDRMARATQALTLGDPLDPTVDMGPVSNRAQFQKVIDYVDLGQSEGAEVVAGGARCMTTSELSKGLFFEPTVFANVSNESRLAQEEIFGPVASIIRFRDEDEAVKIANASDFGLAAGVWTNDVSRAHRMIRRVRSGTVWVNTYRLTNYSVPFGGFKQSGIGRELGPDALDAYTEVKSAWIDLGNQQAFGRH
ncbi:carnitine dehydratase [Pseudarthrobacter sulfonivorans]|uniref:Carnitine dehydratase n=1 Tax=Pseudarthrobacter sulfonivorans TaxID=121292 RepID=A0A0U3Q6T4_9MICC|nr:aldehyde dehydrogenase [Pseudarthrobacter sulfonivorans]ALV40013.1 carnitine dehydratase [Pseudarthrobacter sulfonivorans]